MKTLLLATLLIIGSLSTFANTKPATDTVKVLGYSKCFYVSFEAICCDGIKRYGYIGIRIANGIPSEAGIKHHVALQLHAIPDCIKLTTIANMANVDYVEMFAGKYGKVILHK